VALYFLKENIMNEKTINANYGRIARQTYKNHCGEIPKSYDIHHVNMDRSNNNIANLIALPRKIHYRVHSKIARAAGVFRRKAQDRRPNSHPSDIKTLERLIYQYNNNIF